jgi:hypothetical protein
MNFKRLLHSSLGQIFISILLGLGLATIFRKVCNDRNCIHFKGPLSNKVDGKVFKHGESCYKYTVKNADKCNDMKKIVNIASSIDETIPK